MKKSREEMKKLFLIEKRPGAPDVGSGPTHKVKYLWEPECIPARDIPI
jgi:hypothetical protein